MDWILRLGFEIHYVVHFQSITPFWILICLSFESTFVNYLCLINKLFNDQFGTLESNTVPKTWHLISPSGGSRASVKCYAQFLKDIILPNSKTHALSVA